MGYGQVIWNWLEGFLSSLFSEVWDQIAGVFGDLRFSLIDSLFWNIVSGNSGLQEIFETIDGFIAIVEALVGLVGSATNLVIGLLFLAGISCFFSKFGDLSFAK